MSSIRKLRSDSLGDEKRASKKKEAETYRSIQRCRSASKKAARGVRESWTRKAREGGKLKRDLLPHPPYFRENWFKTDLVSELGAVPTSLDNADGDVGPLGETSGQGETGDPSSARANEREKGIGIADEDERARRKRKGRKKSNSMISCCCPRRRFEKKARWRNELAKEGDTPSSASSRTRNGHGSLHSPGNHKVEVLPVH